MSTNEDESQRYIALYSPIELAKFETSIGVYSPIGFHELLLDPESVEYRYSNMVQEVGSVLDEHGLLVTTMKDPAILVESNASFCSIMLTADTEGNASVLHTTLVSPYDQEDRVFSTEVDREIVEYRRSVKRNIDQKENFTILTGLSDSTEHNANLLVEALKEFLGQAYSNVRRMTEPIDLEFLDMFRATGLIFIPKYLTKTGRNIILFSDNQIDISLLLSDTN